ncbi:MAG: tetratricopeptide repeat protein [Alphaproteobacteria bacterium]|nr:tetratricopeptide repeat protein [Alphaproteobacteria bacterium]
MWRAHGMVRAGHLAEAESLYAQARAVFAASGEPRGEAEALLNLAELERARGDLGAARSHLERAAELARSEDAPQLQAPVEGALGSLLRSVGETEEAGPHLLRALEMEQRLGVRQRIGRAQLNLAALNLDLESVTMARAFCTQAMKEAQAAQDDRLQVASALMMAAITAESGALEVAEADIRATLQHALEANVPQDRAAARLALGSVLLERGAWAEALQPLDGARAEYASLGAFTLLADTLGRMAVAHAHLGEAEVAERLLTEATRLSDGHPVLAPLLELREVHLRLATEENPARALGAAAARFSKMARSAAARWDWRVLRAAVAGR